MSERYACVLSQHKGSLRHAAMPIEGGERQNLIIWLFGDGGEVWVGLYLIVISHGSAQPLYTRFVSYHIQ